MCCSKLIRSFYQLPETKLFNYLMKFTKQKLNFHKRQSPKLFQKGSFMTQILLCFVCLEKGRF
jgi:hypothetical protein